MTCARPTRAKFQKILGNLEKLGNIGSFKTSQNNGLAASIPAKMKTSQQTDSKKLLKNRNYSFPVVRYFA